ncbi:AraC family transcriptional regulator [Coralloluteibacterium thermophilus]|uniref:AraC family transcriptional regulator n=1 Tax=Coralloluteibacterium thermophilum TaxID=2707049 RepID=A0ABV9NKJ0_9GAMM
MIEQAIPAARSAQRRVFTELSTDTVPWRERYEFWHEHVRAHFNWELLRGRDPGNGFQARFRHWMGDEASFVDMSCGECRVARTADAGDELRLILMSAGQARIERRADAGIDCVSAGSLYLLDPGAVSRATWSAHHDLCLKLPRRAVVEAVGSDPLKGGAPICMLPNSGIAPFLTTQMRMLASHGTGMDAEDCASVLQNASALALFLLRRFLRREDAAPEEAHDALLVAAKRYIERHHRSHELNPDDVAAAVGCSRRQLYRIFGKEQLTVAGYLREVRLQQCRSDLERGGGGREVRIGAIAYAHGFADLPAFSKLFKRRFGVSPSEIAGGGATAA